MYKLGYGTEGASKGILARHTGEPCMIAGILLKNQNPEPRTNLQTSSWTKNAAELTKGNNRITLEEPYKPIQHNNPSRVELDVKRSKNRSKRRIIWIAQFNNLAEDPHA